MLAAFVLGIVVCPHVASLVLLVLVLLLLPIWHATVCEQLLCLRFGPSMPVQLAGHIHADQYSWRLRAAVPLAVVIADARVGSEIRPLCALGLVFLVRTQLVHLWVVEVVVAKLIVLCCFAWSVLLWLVLVLL